MSPHRERGLESRRGGRNLHPGRGGSRLALTTPGRGMDRFSPSEAALEGFRVTREHPGTILAWSFIYMGVLFLIALAMMATLGPAFITMAREGKLLSAQTDPEQMADMLLKSWPAFL